MSKPKLNGADYLLLLLYLNKEEPIMGAVRLTKMMFLFKEEIAPLLKKKGLESDKLPEFFAYNFGPFSKDVYEQVELFKNIKFIQVTNVLVHEEMAEVNDYEEAVFEDDIDEFNDDYMLNADGKYYKYQILKKGEQYVESEILPLLTNEQITLITQFRNKMTALSPKNILKYVYTKYPEYTKKSQIIEEVLQNG